jgi:hypothetical protein
VRARVLGGEVEDVYWVCVEMQGGQRPAYDKCVHAWTMYRARADVAERGRGRCGCVLMIFLHICKCENSKLIGVNVSETTQRGIFGREWDGCTGGGVGWCARSIQASTGFTVNYCRRACLANVGLEDARYCKR